MFIVNWITSREALVPPNLTAGNPHVSDVSDALASVSKFINWLQPSASALIERVH